MQQHAFECASLGALEVRQKDELDLGLLVTSRAQVHLHAELVDLHGPELSDLVQLARQVDEFNLGEGLAGLVSLHRLVGHQILHPLIT